MTPALTGSAQSREDFLEGHVQAQPSLPQNQEDAACPAVANLGRGWAMVHQLHGLASEPDTTLLALVHKDVGVALLGEVPDLGAIERVRGKLHAAGFVEIFGGYPPIVFRVMPPSELPLEDLLEAAFALEPRLSLDKEEGWERAACEILAGGKVAGIGMQEESPAPANGTDAPQGSEANNSASEEALRPAPGVPIPQPLLASLPAGTEAGQGARRQAASSGLPPHSLPLAFKDGSSCPDGTAPKDDTGEDEPRGNRSSRHRSVALLAGGVLMLALGGLAAFHNGGTPLNLIAAREPDRMPGAELSGPEPHPAETASHRPAAPAAVTTDAGAPRAGVEEPEPGGAGSAAAPVFAIEPALPERAGAPPAEAGIPGPPEDTAGLGSEQVQPSPNLPKLATPGSPDAAHPPVEQPTEIAGNPQASPAASDVETGTTASMPAGAGGARHESAGGPVLPAPTEPAGTERAESAMPVIAALSERPGDPARPGVESASPERSTASGVTAPGDSPAAAPVAMSVSSNPAQSPEGASASEEREEARRSHDVAASMPARPAERVEASAALNATTRQVRMAPAMLLALIQRGDAMLALGDLSAARLLYERAAAGGDGHAATAAGKTYDPAFLARFGGVIPGDPAMAAGWYRRAIALGDREAEEALARLEVAGE